MKSRIGLLTLKGLSVFTLKELAQRGLHPRTAEPIALRNHDLLLFRPEDLPAKVLPTLRTVEDVFDLPVTRLPLPDRAAFKKLAKLWTQQAFIDGLARKNLFTGKPRPAAHTVAVFVKADRDRILRRHEIAEHLAAVPLGLGRWRYQDPAAVEIWGFFAENELSVGVRLSDNTFRVRADLQRERESALRPTIAAAMAVASDPRPDDVVLDPMCGTGTLLYERGRLGPCQVVIGVDTDPEAVRLALANLGRLGGESVVTRGDARELDLPERSVDCILCNLPFGKTWSNEADNAGLYHKLAYAFRRVLKPGGRLVLLTADQRHLRMAFGNRGGYQVQELARIKVLGLDAELATLTLRPGGPAAAP